MLVALAVRAAVVFVVVVAVVLLVVGVVVVVGVFDGVVHEITGLSGPSA